MSNTWALTKKEFRAYLSSPMGYIYLVVFLVLSNWLFMRGFFLINQASFRGFFALLPWLFLIFLSAVTMRLWAEERKLGTLEVLLTLPFRDHEVLLGKYLSSLAFLAVSLLLTLPLPLSGSFLGQPDWGQVIGGYLGAFFLGSAFLAIGLFASSLTESQIVAFIFGVVLSFLLLAIGEEFFLLAVPSFLHPLLKNLGLGYHYESMARGVLDTRDILYYLSFVGFFLYATLRILEVKR